MNKKRYLFIFAIIFAAAGFYFFNVFDWKGAVQVKKSEVVDLNNGDTFDLTAAYVTKNIGGRGQTILAYNGSIPGPTIRVPQGAEVTINFKNDTDLPALLHSHGVRMENVFDGSQLVQKEMKPGESFAYKLRFPDAGVYWYHPHAKEVFEQPLGLYGAFIVTPRDSAYFPPVNREIPLFLSDLPVVNGIIALDKNETSHSLMGHYGTVMLVNGEERFDLQAKTGEVVRLYVINSANARPFNFAIEGLTLKRVGGDSGAYEKASFEDNGILGPSERAIIDVLMPKAGVYELQNKTPERTYLLGTISVREERIEVSYEKEFNVLQNNAATKQSIDAFRRFFDIAPDKRIALTLDMGGDFMSMMGGYRMPDGTMMPARRSFGAGGGGMMPVPSNVEEANSELDGIEWEDTMWMMNAMSNTDLIKWNIVDQNTGKENMNIDWSFKRGAPVKIRIFNDPNSPHPMQHPIHFHGQRFLMLARDGVKETNMAWKDTVLIPSSETVDILLDTSNPGKWMAHCHIAEHLEAGMMFGFTVL